MDYKEKLRLAKEALDSGSYDKDTIEYIFPELKESEDEKIRKEIIDHISNIKSTTISDLREKQFDSWIAWLEKQGEHANFRNKIQIGDKVTRNEDGVLVNLSQLNRVAKKDEKQGEQKPDKRNILSAKKGDMLSNGTIVLIVDSIEEFEGRPIINSWYFADSEKFYGKGTSECDRWEVDGFRNATEAECNYLFKMIDEAGYIWNKENNLLEDKKSAEWSNKDSLMLNCTISALQSEADRKDGYIDKYTLKDLEKWLKSLKGRIQPQPKQKWSEEDETILEKCIGAVKVSCYSYSFKSEAENWLKSLRPQWKPNEEMLEALYRAIPKNVMEISEDEMLLDKLYQGLKYGRVLSEK